MSMSEERIELRRIALEHLTKSMPESKAGRADGGEAQGDGASGGVPPMLSRAGQDDDLPENIFDIDKVLENTPLLRTDNAFHDTMNTDDTIRCPFILNKPGPDGAGIEAVVRFGKSTCGHPKTVHGGVTALVLESLLGMALFMQGAGPVFTASLKVDYKAMLPCTTTVVVDVTVDRTEGWKLSVTGRLKSLDGEVLYATAEALFIKPGAPREGSNADA